jgi:hypothetical protein
MRRLILWLLGTAAMTLAGQVQVEILENLPAGKELLAEGGAVTDSYREPAFAFLHTPTRFAANAIPLDRSTPFVLRAQYSRSMAAGEYRFRLRARGAAVLYIDGNEVARTQAQKPNTSGDDPVPPPVVRDGTLLRPAAYPHQDALAKVALTGGDHQFTLVAVIGGKGLYPSPGELAVSYSVNGSLDRLLGSDEAPLLTDAAWEAYEADSEKRHREADVARRRQTGQQVADVWKKRHDNVRERLARQTAPSVPDRAIDHYIGARMQEAKAKPNAMTGDLEFLRRVTLDVTGLIPTPEEIRAYQAADPKTRRQQAIERLLASPSWADHWVSYWQDVLAENPGILKPDLNNTGPFRWWLHQSFSDNLPFDRMVTELIEMEGSLHLGGPAAFSQATLNDAPMAAKADIIAQAFLGVKLQCARCHDAPFHPYKQQDLFGMAAMLEGKPLKLPETSTVPIREGARKPVVNVALKPGQMIAPEWRFQSLVNHAETGDVPSSTGVATRREVAAYVVSAENLRFAQVVANRVWKRYMGVGIVEPVDDWTRGKPSHPELLDWLAREFMMNGYDMKHLARLILSSDAYQRKPSGLPSEMMSAEKRLFTGPARRNLTAEQLVDSLHMAAGKTLDCEEMNLNPAGDRPARQFLNMGRPRRGWQMTALSNERDRPALALPIAQSVVDVMTTFGWRQSRQNPATERDDAASPMQTLILANGVLGTRIARLSDDSAFTELAMGDLPLEKLIEESFLRILSRYPTADERRTFTSLLEPHYAGRKVKGAEKTDARRESDSRVSWSNHLSAEATLIRLEEEKKLRFGAQPTKRLKPEFRERYEDALWAMINTPEFVMMP